MSTTLLFLIESIGQSSIKLSHSFGQFPKKIVGAEPSESKKCASSYWLQNFVNK